jgi:hypothetical protein
MFNEPLLRPGKQDLRKEENGTITALPHFVQAGYGSRYELFELRKEPPLLEGKIKIIKAREIKWHAHPLAFRFVRSFQQVFQNDRLLQVSGSFLREQTSRKEG